MSYQSPVAVARSGNPWIDGLTDGYRWGTTAADPVIGYTFIGATQDLPDGEFAGYPSWGWSAKERAVMLNAVKEISNVCGLKFVDRGDNNDDQVEVWFYSLDASESDGTYGFAYTPGSASDEGLVAVNWSLYRTDEGFYENSIEPGSFYGITYLHELCHAIGLKHPHETGLNDQPRFPGLNSGSNQYKDKGNFNQNAHPFTQLTYVDKGARNGLVPEKIEDYGFLKGPGALDIAALQWLYGINSNFAIGNDVYHLPKRNGDGMGWQSIWDAGGRDRINASNSKADVVIDLRNATLGQNEHAGGYASSVDGVFGGFTIAHDWEGMNLNSPANLCIIEDATGGRGDDRLIGNSARNVLEGKVGDDILYSGGGRNDQLIGGKGRDQFWINSDPNSFVKVMDFSKKDTLVFDVEAAELNVKFNRNSVVLSRGGERLVKLFDLNDFSLESQDFSGFKGV